LKDQAAKGVDNFRIKQVGGNQPQSSLVQRKVEAVKISASDLVDPYFSQRRHNSFRYQSAVLLHGVAGRVRADVIEPTIDQLA
jgi:hypothetical protein